MAKRRMNNEGCIFYRKDRKLWTYKVPDHLQGIAKAKSFSASTQKELKYKIEELYRANDTMNISLSKLTIPELLYEHEKDKFKKNLISNQTLARNSFTINIIEKSNLGNIPIQNVKTSDLDDFSYKVISYAQSTINKIFVHLNKAFNLAEDKNIISKNIMRNYIKPISSKKTKKINAFTLEEQKEFISLIPNSKYFMQYMIALNTGMRIGEINALHIKDIDLKNKKININKTIARDIDFKDFISDSTKTKNGIRTVPINDILYPHLKEFCEDKHGFLFSENRIVSAGMVNSEMKRLCSKSNIIKLPVNTHMIRHTFATRCIEAGMPAVVLAKLLGHADISTTLNTYTDVFNKFKIEHLENATNYIKDLF